MCVLVCVWAFPGQVPKKLLVVAPLGKFEGWGLGGRKIIFHGSLFFAVFFPQSYTFVHYFFNEKQQKTSKILRRTKKDFVAPTVLSGLPLHVLTVELSNFPCSLS